jgi:hypothetical protein
LIELRQGFVLGSKIITAATIVAMLKWVAADRFWRAILQMVHEASQPQEISDATARLYLGHCGRRRDMASDMATCRERAG